MPHGLVNDKSWWPNLTGSKGDNVSKRGIERGRKYFCREEVTGNGHTGHFSIDDKDGITAEIFGFDEFFYVDTPDPIILRTADNHIISLFSNITNAPGSSSHLMEPRMVVHNQHIISNIAVVGRNPWKAEDLVRTVRFRVEHTRDLLTHDATFKKHIKGKPFRKRNEIVKIDAGSATLRVGYSMQYSFTLDHVVDIWPAYELEYTPGKDILSYLDYVHCIVQFLSAALGTPLIPTCITVSRLTNRQMMRQVGKTKYSGDHDVEYIWKAPEYDSRRATGVHGAFARTWDDEELSAFTDCAAACIARHDVWDTPNKLMVQALRLRNEVSAQRLLNACRWLEELPNTASMPAIPDEDVQLIADSASARAAELGYGDLTRRIAGSIKHLRKESHDARFARLVALIRAKFGDKILYEDIVDRLRKAIEFRGRVAHGHFEAKDEAELKEFMHCTCALECFCYLMTLLELPINDEGRRRVSGNAFVDEYRMSYFNRAADR